MTRLQRPQHWPLSLSATHVPAIDRHAHAVIVVEVGNTNGSTLISRVLAVN